MVRHAPQEGTLHAQTWTLRLSVALRRQRKRKNKEDCSGNHRSLKKNHTSMKAAASAEIEKKICKGIKSSVTR